jgi:hypothetical protein
VKRPTPLHKLHRRGSPGYSLFIREFKRPPDEKKIREVIRELSDIYQKNKIYPNRIILLFNAGSRYNGLDDELYDWLVDERLKLPGHLKRYLNIQVVAELPEGSYDFVPFIPELKGYLP